MHTLLQAASPSILVATLNAKLPTSFAVPGCRGSYFLVIFTRVRLLFVTSCQDRSTGNATEIGQRLEATQVTAEDTRFCVQSVPASDLDTVLESELVQD